MKWSLKILMLSSILLSATTYTGDTDWRFRPISPAPVASPTESELYDQGIHTAFRPGYALQSTAKIACFVGLPAIRTSSTNSDSSESSQEYVNRYLDPSHKLTVATPPATSTPARVCVFDDAFYAAQSEHITKSNAIAAARKRATEEERAHQKPARVAPKQISLLAGFQEAFEQHLAETGQSS